MNYEVVPLFLTDEGTEFDGTRPFEQQREDLHAKTLAGAGLLLVRATVLFS